MANPDQAFLTEQINLLDRILAASTDHIYVMDRAGRYQYASPPGLAALGLKAGAMVGKTWRQLNFPADIMERHDAQRESVFQTGISVQGEARFPTVEGVRYYEYVISPIMGPEGETEAVISTVRDITERQQAEAALRAMTEGLEARVQARTEELAAINQSLRWEIAERQKAEQALQESELRFRTLVDAIFEGIVVQENGKIIDANRGFAQMFGYSPEAVIGMSAVDFLTPESLQTVQQHSANQYEDPYELTGIRQDGTLISLEVVGKQSLYQGRRVRVSAARDITARKRAEAALREQEEQTRLATEAADLGMWFWDLPRNQLVWTDRCKTMFGLAPDASISYDVFINALHPDDRQATQAAISQALEQQVDYNIEYRTRWPDGSIHWIAARGRGMHDADGHPLRMMGTVQDISDRKQAEAELRQTEALYCAIAHNFPNGAVHIFDHDLRYLLSDGEEMRRVGLSKENLEGHTLWEVLPPETIAILEPHYRTTLAGEITTTELHFADQIYQLYTLPLRNPQGDIYAGLSISQNVTLLKQAEQTLRNARDELDQQVQARTHELQAAYTLLEEREQEFRTLVENTPDVITRHDRQHRCVYINPASSQALGLPPEFFLGKTPAQMGYPEDLAQFWQTSLESVFVNGQMRIDEFVVMGENGPLYFQVYVVPEKAPDQSIQSVMTIGRDVTPLRQSEESARQLAEELQRSNQELEQFAYVASHDLQEPLRAITSFTQLLAKRYRGQLDAKADTYIEFIVDGATRMQQLIRDLLAYSRAGRYELKLQAVDSNALLERVQKDLQVMIAETEATITADPLPVVTADPIQLGNVIQNLISNSLKYRSKTPPEIHVAARKDCLKSIVNPGSYHSPVRGADGLEEWVFSVSDNGIGIDPQYNERIFRIFQRLHSRDEYSGTGLGLAICRKIIERHGGRIWVESHLAQGSTFFFTLPIAAGPDYGNPSPTADHSSG